MHSNSMVGESAPETPELSSLKAVELVVPKQHKNVDFLPLVHHEGVVFFNQTSAALSGQ